MKNIEKVKFIVAIFCIKFHLGCIHEPSSVGKNLISDHDKLISSIMTIMPDTSLSYPITSSNNSTTLMVGRYNDIIAEMLLQFGQIKVDTNIAESIVSVNILMIPNYMIKDTVGVLSILMHRMHIPWNETTINANNMDTYDLNPIEIPPFEISHKDSIIKLPINENIVRGWLKGEKNYGIILTPKLTSNIIVGFKSEFYSIYDDSRPRLEITYRLATDTVDNTVIYRTVQDATVFFGKRPISTDSLFYVQGGLIERGRLKFDISSIPKSAAITRAFLELKIDTNASVFSNFTLKGLRVHNVVTNELIPILGSSSSSAMPIANLYSIDVRHIVQLWVTGQPNYGVVVRADNEFEEIERFAIYGFMAQLKNKPKLIIHYTYLP